MDRRARVAMATAFGLAALMVPAAPAAADHGGPHCYGFNATILGTEGQETDHGTPNS